VLGDVPTWFLRPLAVVFGLLWGSFLNVVIYRLPREMSVAHPPSSCGGCGARIKPYDNIPVLSWLILRGRARCCGARISPRYPLVELIGAALGLATLELVWQTVPSETLLIRAAAVFLAYFALSLGLVAAAFIDAEHMYLPDSITLGGTVLGVVTATLRGMALSESVLGAAVGFVGVWLPFIVIYARVRGRQGMGMGDAKLTMLAGAWFGFGGAAFVLFAGAIQGTLGALVILLVKGKIEEPQAVREDRAELKRAAGDGDAEAAQILADDPLGDEPNGQGIGQARLPFGPFLILACLEWLFAKEYILAAYRGTLSGGA
jgi:leader peptidase (prepilin peptidase)/N-methyltransferase